MKYSYRFIQLAFLLVVIIIGGAGCMPEDELTITGPTVVEIKNHTLGVIDVSLNRIGVYMCTTQTDSSRTVNQDAIAYKAASNTPNSLTCVTAGGNTYKLAANAALAANAKVSDTILVQLVGPQRSTPTVLDYTVRSASTAVVDVNYKFRATPGKVTIPANSSFGYIIVDILPAITAANTSVRLIVDLVGNSEVKANPRYSKFLLTIRKN